MKLRILSDLHLGIHSDYELGYFGEDALLFAGDLCSTTTRSVGEQVLRQSKVPIYYVLGNHEAYDDEYHATIEYFRLLEARIPGFNLLHNRAIRLGKFLLLGTPLWTDFGLYGDVEHGKELAHRHINDFRYVSFRAGQRTRTLLPADYAKFHVGAIKFLTKHIAKGLPTLVMTHWCPSADTIHPNFIGDECNPYFTCECKQLMQPNVVLWVHGHSHAPLDMHIGGTRVIRNPYGYARESKLGFRQNCIVEV